MWQKCIKLDITADLELHGGEESGAAELGSKVMDEMEMSVAKMPANVRTRTAKLELQIGEESGTAELESEVRKVMDEIEMRLAKLHGNGRDKAELKPLGGEESGTAEPENQVTDEMELSLANMPANEKDGKAEMELQGGEESGTVTSVPKSKNDRKGSFPKCAGKQPRKPKKVGGDANKC